jgi:hypothetical protein
MKLFKSHSLWFSSGYNLFVAFKVYDPSFEKGSKKLWAYCECPAGVQGSCKHSNALLFKVWELKEMNMDELEMEFDLPTPTGNRILNSSANFLRKMLLFVFFRTTSAMACQEAY